MTARGPWTIQLLHYLPPSANLYARKIGVRTAAVKKLLKLLEPWWVSLGGQNPDCIPPATRPRRVSVRLTYPSKAHHMDHDNTKKVLLDALKQAGLIKDDSPKWVEVEQLPDEVGLVAVTEITLADIAPRLSDAAEDDVGCQFLASSDRGFVRMTAEEKGKIAEHLFVFSPDQARVLAANLVKAAQAAERWQREQKPKQGADRPS